MWASFPLPYLNPTSKIKLLHKYAIGNFIYLLLL